MKSIIEVENLSKSYTIGKREAYGSLREEIMQTISAPFRRLKLKTSNLTPNTEPNTIWALRDVSFSVNEGEVVGIIGRNGAGKSTLLKILSRITEPTSGRITMRGRVASLLEVGTGFHPELTGRENIFLNGALLGMSNAEIRKKFDEIVAFSEIEKFLDTPVKRYSSGMYVRLAFAVAAHLDPEILIVDEVLAVGDAQFQKKCMGKMGDVAKGGRTVLFVSHNMAAVSALCTRGIVLNSGKLEFCGAIEEATAKYFEPVVTSDVVQVLDTASRVQFKFNRFWVEDRHEQPIKNFISGQYGALVIECESSEPMKGVHIAMGIFDMTGSRITRVSMADLCEEFEIEGIRQVRCIFEKVPFAQGRYTATIGAYQSDTSVRIDRHAISFQVIDADYYGRGATQKEVRLGPVLLDYAWSIKLK